MKERCAIDKERSGEIREEAGEEGKEEEGWGKVNKDEEEERGLERGCIT